MAFDREKHKRKDFGFSILSQRLDFALDESIRYLDYTKRYFDTELRFVEEGLTEERNLEDYQLQILEDKSYELAHSFPNELKRSLFISQFGTFEYHFRIAYKVIYQLKNDGLPLPPSSFKDIWKVKEEIRKLLNLSQLEFTDTWTQVNYLKELRNSIIHNNSSVDVNLSHLTYTKLDDLISQEYEDYISINYGTFSIINIDFLSVTKNILSEFFAKMSIQVKENTA
jgi:hypothetical protein